MFVCGCEIRGCFVVAPVSLSDLMFICQSTCRVYVGPVRSVLVEKLDRCTVAIAAQQLRIHSASECDFYVRMRRWVAPVMLRPVLRLYVFCNGLNCICAAFVPD